MLSGQPDDDMQAILSIMRARRQADEDPSRYGHEMSVRKRIEPGDIEELPDWIDWRYNLSIPGSNS